VEVTSKEGTRFVREAYGEEATELEREVTTITRMHIFDRSIKDQFTITKYA
jgi:hypothetical protein